jgi:hypothetical protein
MYLCQIRKWYNTPDTCLKYEIRDPIHDFIRFSDDEIQIINSESFQRLRRIKQLAFTYLVYPGALHTRYEHSLGTCHLAHRIAERLDLNQMDKKAIRMAALLHDIGHLPFSHVGEEMMALFSKGESKSKGHEDISLAMIEGTDRIATILDGGNGPGVENVIEILKPKINASGSLKLASSIISGQIDVDKMDYLLRDCHYTGVKYGIYDLDRLINTVCKAEKESRMAFEEGAVPALEQMILARYFMREQVYLHKTRIIADAMAIRAVELAVKDKAIDANIFDFNTITSNLDKYLLFDDESLIQSFLQCTCPDTKELIQGLRNRRLLRSVVRLRIDKESIPEQDLRMIISDMSKDHEKLHKIEEEFAQRLRLSPNQTIMNIQSIKAPTVPAPGGTTRMTDVEDVLIKDEGGSIKPMSQFVNVLRTQNDEGDRKEMLYILAPVEKWSNMEIRKEIKDRSKEAILEILKGEI